jgi:hypothetical protein
VIKTPFAEYENFEDCVAKNSDKEDPAAYCAVIQRKAERTESLRTFLFAEKIGLEGNVVKGVAIHPKVIWHPEEGVNWKAKHDYQREELKKAAESLSGKPFGINHLRLLPPPNRVSRSWWDEQQNGVAFEGTVDDDIAGKIREGKFRGLSIECDWTKPGKYVMLEKTDAGVAMKNFELTSVHLLDRFPPGDREAYVEMWEGIVLPVVPPPIDVQINMIRELFEERLRFLEGQVAAMSQNAGTLGLQSPAIVIFKEAQTKFTAEIAELRKVMGTFDKLKEAVLSEKTVIETKKTEFDGALKLMAERLNTPPPSESDVIVAVRKEKVALEGRLADTEGKLTRETNAAEQKYRALHKALVESIPYPHIWASWSCGPKRMVQEQLGILGVQSNNYG